MGNQLIKTTGNHVYELDDDDNKEFIKWFRDILIYDSVLYGKSENGDEYKIDKVNLKRLCCNRNSKKNSESIITIPITNLNFNDLVKKYNEEKNLKINIDEFIDKAFNNSNTTFDKDAFLKTYDTISIKLKLKANDKLCENYNPQEPLCDTFYKDKLCPAVYSNNEQIYGKNTMDASILLPLDKYYNKNAYGDCACYNSFLNKLPKNLPNLENIKECVKNSTEEYPCTPITRDPICYNGEQLLMKPYYNNEYTEYKKRPITKVDCSIINNFSRISAEENVIFKDFNITNNCKNSNEISALHSKVSAKGSPITNEVSTVPNEVSISSNEVSTVPNVVSISSNEVSTVPNEVSIVPNEASTAPNEVAIVPSIFKQPSLLVIGITSGLLIIIIMYFIIRRISK